MAGQFQLTASRKLVFFTPAQKSAGEGRIALDRRLDIAARERAQRALSQSDDIMMREGGKQFTDKARGVHQREDLLIAIGVNRRDFERSANQRGAGRFFVARREQHFSAFENAGAPGSGHCAALLGCQYRAGRRVFDGAVFASKLNGGHDPSGFPLLLFQLRVEFVQNTLLVFEAR